MRLLPNADLRRLAIRHPEDVPLARSKRLRHLRLSRHLRIELMPQQVVKSRFLKLNSSHIEYVLDAMNKNPSDIRNIRAYLLTALYNASLTIDNYYSALVNHDFYGQDRSAGSKKPKTYDYSLCEDTL